MSVDLISLVTLGVLQTEESDYDTIDFDKVPVMFSGVKTVAFPYGARRKQTLYIKCDRPVPLCVRSITPNYELT